MKRIFQKVVSLVLVILMILSLGPLEGLTKVDLLFPFKTIATAVEKAFEPVTLSDIEVTSVRRAEENGNTLSTQSENSSIPALTVGDEIDIHVDVLDKEGNPISDYGTVSWTASPSDAVSISVWSDTRDCTVTIISTKYRSVTITASAKGGSTSFTYEIAGLTFDKDNYYIIAESTSLVDDLTSVIPNNCFAIWVCGETSYSIDAFEFSSSDESILKISEKGRSVNYGKKVFYYPSVCGVSEGEATLTIKAPDGQTARCSVEVIGLKEYTLKVKSKELDIPLADTKINYEIRRSSDITTQAETTVSTDGNGVITIKLPDVKKYPVTLELTSSYHKDKSISSGVLNESEINPVQMNMEDIDVSDIENGSDSLKGPTITVFGKEISLFDVAVKGELKIGDFQLNVDNVEHKIEILIGLGEVSKDAYVGPNGQSTTYWSESYREVKELYKTVTGKKVDTTKLWNNFSKLRGKLKKINGSLGVDVSASLAGYIEFSYATGKIVFKEGGISAAASAGISLEAKYPAFPAVYGTFGLEADATGKICLSHKEDFDFNVGGEFKLDLTANLGIGVGDKKLLSTYIEGGLQGEINTSLDVNFTPFSGAFSASLTGSLYLKGEAAGFALLNITWPFVEEKLYPKENSVVTNSISETFTEVAKKAKPISRDYLNNSELYTNSTDFDYIKSSLYPYSNPQLFELSNGNKILIWIDDLGTKNDVNKTSIMYSIYNGKSWSTEKTIYEDGAYNGSPVAYCDGDNVYVVWQKANSAMDNSTTMDALLKNIDLYYSCFNGTNFSTPVRISNSDKFEMSYSVTAYNGQILVTWLENSENDIFLSNGTNSVYYKTIKNGVVSDAEKIYTTENDIASLVSSNYDGNVNIAFSVDGTKESIYLYSNKSVKEIVSNENNSYQNLAFEKNNLFYIMDNQLYSYNTDNSLINNYDISSMGNFSIVSNGNNTVILTLVSDGLRCDLYAYDLNDGKLSAPYQLTNYDKYIRSYSAYLDNNNTVQIAANIVDVSEDSNEFYSTATLAVTSCNELKDISIENYVCFDYENVCAGKDLPLSIDIRNNGKTTVNSFTINIKDENTSAITSQTIHETIAGGETKTITLDYKLPSSMSKRMFTVEVLYSGDTDKSNNTSTFTLGEADICLYDCSINEDYTINAFVKNDGYSNASDVTVSVYKLDDEFELIYQKNIGNIDANSNKAFSYSIDKSLVKFDSYFSNNLFKVVVSTTDDETKYVNNEKELIISPTRVSNLSLDKSELILMPASSYQLNATVYPNNAVTKDVIWFSEDSSVASVDQNGKITTHKLGTTVIKAVSIDGEFEDYCTVTVSNTIPVAQVILDKNQTGMKVGDTLQLNASVLPSNASNKSISWTTSNSSIATVSASGLITAKSAGTVVITAKASNGVNATCLINVSNVEISVSSITLSQTTLSIFEGNQIQLSATVYPLNATNQTVVWYSDNSNIASVSEQGLVTAKSLGTTTITVKTSDGDFTAKCNVTVTSKVISVTGISVSPEKISLIKGNDKQLIATIAPLNATNQTVVWSSDNPNVATVSASGLVNAINEGTAKIKVVSVDGNFEAICTVEVFSNGNAEPVSIKVSKMPNKTVYTYKTESFDKTGMVIDVLYSDGSQQSITDTSQFKVSAIPNKKGNHSLEVTYGSLKTTVDVSVKYAWWQWIIVIMLFGWLWY